MFVLHLKSNSPYMLLTQQPHSITSSTDFASAYLKTVSMKSNGLLIELLTDIGLYEILASLNFFTNFFISSGSKPSKS